MSDLIRALYEYACKNHIPAFLSGKEYEELQEIVEQQETRLTALLPPGGIQTWKDFSGDSFLMQSMELEAAFRAGMSIALELTRLP